MRSNFQTCFTENKCKVRKHPKRKEENNVWTRM